MRKTRLQHLPSLAVALALVVFPGCVPIEETDTDTTGTQGDAATPIVTDTQADVGPDVPNTDVPLPTWPPEVTEETETFDVPAVGGEAVWFGGELTVEFADGTFDVETPVEFTRSLVTVSGTQLVGYVWGDHGMPSTIPSATVTVRGRLGWAPVLPDDVSRAALFHVVDDQLVALDDATARIEDGDLVVEGTAGRLSTMVLGVDPLPDWLP